MEIERYMVEFGSEGRLIEMQLEETILGTTAEKGALVQDYLADYSDETFASALDRIGRLAHQDLLDFGRLAELLGYDRKLTRSTSPSPRGPRPRRVPRLPKLVVTQIVDEFGGLDDPLAATDAGSRRSREWGRSGEGRPRGAASPAGDRPRRPLLQLDIAGRSPARYEAGPICRRDEGGHRSRTAIKTQHRPSRSSRRPARSSASSSSSETTVVYPHHGAGKVLQRGHRGARHHARVPHDRILHNDMTVKVPAENAALAGLRRVIDEDIVQKVLAVSAEGRRCPRLEPALQAQPRQDQDGRHVRLTEVVSNLSLRETRRGSRPARSRVHARHQDPRVRAHVCARQGRGRGRLYSNSCSRPPPPANSPSPPSRSACRSR